MKKNIKILIIGGSGSIGITLANNFIKNGYCVSVIDKVVYKYPKEINFINIDFDLVSLNELIEEHDIFIYLLSRLLPAISDSSLLKKDIFSYSNFLDKLKDFQNKKILFFSSGGAVYGESIEKKPILENYCRNPVSLYGYQKKILEDLSLMYSKLYYVEVYILRISNAYGSLSNMSKLQGAIPNLIHAGLKQSVFNVWGDGSVIKDYIHVDDITSACLKIIEYNGPVRVMNLSSGIGRSLMEVINSVNSNLKQDIIIQHIDKKLFDVSYNVLSNDLLKKEISWEPKVNFKDSIKWMVQNLKLEY